MSSSNSKGGRPKARQSLAHVSSTSDLGFDKENATADLISFQPGRAGCSDNERRKLRSKSLGPGGVEALKESAGNASKALPAVQIKSILKPTIPLTPPKAIPSFDETRKRSTRQSGKKSPANSREELLIDFSTPAPSQTVASLSGIEHIQDPFSPFAAAVSNGEAPVPQNTGADDAASKEKEAEDLRKAQKKLILEQRAARRKSMANRRVSFAPDATLHTWNVVEMIEDSTSSSASNSTRRQSSATARQNQNNDEQTITPQLPQEPPSTPPSQVEEPLVKASPAIQRDVQQQQRQRRSSRGSSVLSDPVTENTSSPASAYSDGSAVIESSPIRVEDSIHSSSDEDGDTAMSMDDATGQTVQSQLSGSSTESSLDVRLRSAAAVAGTRGISYDENGEDLSMEMADSTVTNVFQPWTNNGHLPATENAAADDQEEEDMSMEIAEATVTNAFQWLGGKGKRAVQANDTPEDHENETETVDDAPMDLADSTVTNVFHPWLKAGKKPPVLENSTIPDHESGESASMELADSTVTIAFQPWMQGQKNLAVQSNSASKDQENINPFVPGVKRRASDQIPLAEMPSGEMSAARDRTPPASAESPSQEPGAGHATRSKRRKLEETTFDTQSTPPLRKSPRGSPGTKSPGTPVVAKSPSKPSTPKSLRREITESLNQPSVSQTPTKLSTIKSPFAKSSVGRSPLRADITDSLRQSPGKSPSKTPIVRSTSRLPALRSPAKTARSPARTARSPSKGPVSDSSLRPSTAKQPIKMAMPTTPEHDGHFKNALKDAGDLPTSFEDKLDNVFHAVDVSVLQEEPEQESKSKKLETPEKEVEKISLQDFLKLTNIHFMDLSTTKRRHTLATPAPRPSDEGTAKSSAACFAAAATTLPLLELYQHATRELKSYISSGRKVIRSIEQETLEDQPALFRDYVDSRPDVKVVMDNQFRNGKAHARLQSKQGWYVWRKQLVEGLRSGLSSIHSGLEEDMTTLANQGQILAQVVPGLAKQFDELGMEAKMLQQRAEEFDGEDQDLLEVSRTQLEATDDEVAQKMFLLGELQQQLANKKEAITAAAELKAEMQSQIAEAERVQDECRTWKAEDVAALKNRVSAIESRTGWTVITAEHEIEEGSVDYGAALMLRYQNALRLFFYPTAFQPGSSDMSNTDRSRRSKSSSSLSAPISLTYSASRDDGGSLATQQRFVLQVLQSHLHAMSVAPRGSITPKQLLSTISEGWETAIKITEEVRSLGIAGITKVSITSDDTICANCMLMLPDHGRVDIAFTLTISALAEGGISHSVKVDCLPKYGSVATILSGAKGSKVREALNSQAGSRPMGEGAWAGAVRGLEEWIVQQKKPKEEKKHQPTTRPVTKAPAPQAVSISEAQIETPTPAPIMRRKELKKPVPMQSLMEEAAARQEEIARQQEVVRRQKEMDVQEDIRRNEEKEAEREDEERLLMSAQRTPMASGTRRPGALRRTP